MTPHYTDSPVPVPLERRQEINEKILHLIRANALNEHKITAEDVHNTFGSLGGTHGLSRKDYANYYDYSQAKKEIEQGQFFTPPALAQFVVDSLSISGGETVVDLGCGMGRFFNYLPTSTHVYGVEIEPGAATVAQFLYPHASIECGDLRTYDPQVQADVMLLNPPFNLDFGGQTSQHATIQKAHELLRLGGVAAVIIPHSYLGDEFSDKTEIEWINKNFHCIAQYAFSSDAFASAHASINTKVLYLAKRSSYLAEKEYNPQDFILGSLEQALPQLQKLMQDFYAERYKQRALIRSEEAAATEASADFSYKVDKFLYDIDVSPALIEKRQPAHQLVSKFLTQKKPPQMSVETWNSTKITEKYVLNRLRKIVKLQHAQPRDVSEVVKVKGGLRYKGYSEAARRKLKREGLDEVVPFRSLTHDKTMGYHRLIQRKQRELDQQVEPYADIDPLDYPEIHDFLENLVLRSSTGEEIHLNDIQKQDTLCMLTKRYNYLQWGTGSGKTVSAMAQSLYRLQRNQVRNVYVVSTAIAVNNTLEETFADFGFAVRRVRKLSDIHAIKQGEVVMMTFHALAKYRKFIREHTKIISGKALLILDEADSISNVSSARSKATLACFRRLKYKLLMSATSTRNNVGESFTAFELLYNNSDAMINWSPKLYFEPQKKGDTLLTEDDGFIHRENKNYGQPFAAYTKGALEFRRSFSPTKSSVFGVAKTNQDVRNKSALSQLISYSMLTRSFEEVSGKQLYAIRQERVCFSADEKEMYQQITNEFYRFYHLYTSTGSTRKDAMLRIIQQLNTLLRAPVQPGKYAPHIVESSKYPRLRSLCQQFSGEQVVIGATHVSTVSEYAQRLEQDFPGRKVFTATGASTTLDQRRKLVEQLRESGDGILVCTQQSLSSSMNIGFIDRVILLELQWNFAAMNQFFARFVRYTSERAKDIIFLLNEDSIEVNLLKLLLNKEKMNLFMRNVEVDDEELWNYFGVDDDLFDSLFSREVDSEGRSYISWGEQKVS